jgi:hypothetical protein
VLVLYVNVDDPLKSDAELNCIEFKGPPGVPDPPVPPQYGDHEPDIKSIISCLVNLPNDIYKEFLLYKYTFGKLY